MVTKCDVCGRHIAFWRFSELINNKLHCFYCFKEYKFKNEKKEIGKTKRGREEIDINENKNSKGDYKLGFIILGVLIIIVVFYVIFVLEGANAHTLLETKEMCNNPLLEIAFFSASNISETCRLIKIAFYVLIGGMIFGIISILIGIVQNLMIYNYRLNKQR